MGREEHLRTVSSAETRLFGGVPLEKIVAPFQFEVDVQRNDLLLWIDAGDFDDAQADGHRGLTEILRRRSGENVIAVELRDTQAIQLDGIVRFPVGGNEESDECGEERCADRLHASSGSRSDAMRSLERTAKIYSIISIIPSGT